jgi:hypothetical protein
VNPEPTDQEVSLLVEWVRAWSVNLLAQDRCSPYLRLEPLGRNAHSQLQRLSFPVEASRYSASKIIGLVGVVPDCERIPPQGS